MTRKNHAADLLRFLDENHELMFDDEWIQRTLQDARKAASRKDWSQAGRALLVLGVLIGQKTATHLEPDAARWQDRLWALRRYNQDRELDDEELRAQIDEWDDRIAKSGYTSKTQAMIRLGISRRRYYRYKEKLRNLESREK